MYCITNVNKDVWQKCCITKVTKRKYCITKVNKDVLPKYCITKVNKGCYDQSIVLQSKQILYYEK